MMLNNLPTMMKIDTGSDVTVISSGQQIQQGSQKLQLTTKSFPCWRTYSGEMIQLVGRVTVDVYHQEKSYQLPCVVVKCAGRILLGRVWLKHLKLNWSPVHRMDSADYGKYFRSCSVMVWEHLRVLRQHCTLTTK